MSSLIFRWILEILKKYIICIDLTYLLTPLMTSKQIIKKNYLKSQWHSPRYAWVCSKQLPRCPSVDRPTNYLSPNLSNFLMTRYFVKIFWVIGVNLYYWLILFIILYDGECWTIFARAIFGVDGLGTEICLFCCIFIADPELLLGLLANPPWSLRINHSNAH